MAANLRELLAGLKAAEQADRLEAAETLMRLAEEAAPAAAALAWAAGDEDEEVREAAVGALEGLGAPPAALLGELTKLLHDAQPDRAYWAATLLGRIGTAAAPAVPDLIQVLGPAAPLEVRQRAAWALGQLGPAAAGAADALKLAAEHRDARLAELARDALAAIAAKN
ncbi:MAG TPA: HEAT repeat domain-containing protein [Pirellulales bacterium]